MKTTLVRPFPIILQYEECGEKVGRERRLRYYKGIFPYFLLAAVNANTNESALGSSQFSSLLCIMLLRCIKLT